MEELTRRLASVVVEVAGNEILPRFHRVAFHHKVDGTLVSAADTAVQAALAPALRQIADVPILGEEMTEAEQQAAWAQRQHGLWIIDPVDGTTNFINGLPYFCVSVGLWRDGRPCLGVVHAPALNETFLAWAGGGAWLGDQRLPQHQPSTTLARSVAGIDFKRLPPSLAQALGAQPPYGSQRNLGAGALDWCYLAAGRLHVYAHGGQKLWDFAAGWLILDEAGGAVYGLDGGDFGQADPWQRSVLAVAPGADTLAWRQWVSAHL